MREVNSTETFPSVRVPCSGILPEGEGSVWLTSMHLLSQIGCSSYWIYIFLFYKTTNINEEVNSTEPSPSASLPCLHHILCLHRFGHLKNISRGNVFESFLFDESGRLSEISVGNVSYLKYIYQDAFEIRWKSHETCFFLRRRRRTGNRPDRLSLPLFLLLVW